MLVEWITATVAQPEESIEAIIEQAPDAFEDFKNESPFFGNHE